MKKTKKFLFCIVFGSCLMRNCWGFDPNAAEIPKWFSSCTIDLSQSSLFGGHPSVFSPDRQAWGQAESDGRVSYRRFRGDRSSEILFKEFATDEKGFCRYDMLLEIVYQDIIRTFISKSAERNNERIIVKSRIDCSNEKEEVIIGFLDTQGDGQWKKTTIFLEHNPFQLIRSIDGAFHFRLFHSQNQRVNIPISSIRLVAVDQPTFKMLREKDRQLRGLKRDDLSFTELKSRPFVPSLMVDRHKEEKISDLLTLYQTNYLELISRRHEFNCVSTKGLYCFEIPGYIEPISFVLRSKADVNDISFEFSDLKNESSEYTAVLERSNLKLCQVVYNDQRWGWMWEDGYGAIPDYLVPVQESSMIRSELNNLYWLSIQVPISQSAGTYHGVLIIKQNEQKLAEIAICLDVLPVKITKTYVQNFIYHSPSYREYHSEKGIVLQDMQSHGVVPILYPRGKLTRRGDTFQVDLSNLEEEYQRLLSIYGRINSLFIGLSNYYNLYDLLKGPGPRFQVHFPQFEYHYGLVMQQYSDWAKGKGLDLYVSFQDEPFGFKDRRRPAYLCSKIAQEHGLKTWSTHWAQWDKQLELESVEKREGVNYLRPLREVLDVFLDAAGRIKKEDLESMKPYKSAMGYYTTDLDTSARPLLSRFLHGWYAFRINAKFIAAYAYRDAQNDVYDDLDLAWSIANPIGQQDYILTYPSWEGDIYPTLSYEALREGIEDSQIIGFCLELTKREDLNESQKQVSTEAKTFIDSILNRLNGDFYRTYFCRHQSCSIDPMEERILSDLSIETYRGHEVLDYIRWRLCQYIIAMDVE